MIAENITKHKSGNLDGGWKAGWHFSKRSGKSVVKMESLSLIDAGVRG